MLVMAELSPDVGEAVGLTLGDCDTIGTVIRLTLCIFDGLMEGEFNKLVLGSQGKR